MSTSQLTTSDLQNVRRYLAARGWQKIPHPNDRIELLQTLPDQTGDYSSVSIPASPDFRDAGSLVNEALRILAAHEGLPIEQIVDRVRRWDRDILRTRLLKLVGHEDTLPLELASETIARLKEFLGYAAYTQSNPKPFFDKAGGISGEFAKHCHFGHTFRGSFGLAIECPLSVAPVLPMDGIEPEIPMERQIFDRVANGMATIQQAVAADSTDLLIAGYSSGFNANMYRKLAEIYEAVDGRRVEYDITWSPQLRSAYEGKWKPLLFEGRAYDLVRMAASELEKAETYPGTVLEGRIVVLKSDTPPGLDEQAEFEHIVTLYWEREKGQQVKVRVPLSPQQYIEACDAHKEGQLIRIHGVPEKAGKSWTLTKPHSFSVVPNK